MYKNFNFQILALCALPELIDRDEYPEDVKQRAKRILSSCNNNAIGSYTDITGIDAAKYDIAQYITDRDGTIPCDPKNICITAGAVDAIDVKFLIKPVDFNNFIIFKSHS